MGFGESANIVPRISLQKHPDRVLAVGGKVMANGDSATRPKWEVVAHPVILREELGELIFLGKWADLGISDGQPADHACRGHVSLQQYRRHGESVAYVVESLVHFVNGEQ